MGTLADDWQFILEDVIPVDDLPETYKLTAQTHPNAYLITAFDMLTGFEKLKTKRLEFAAEELAAKKKGNRIDYCPEKSRHTNADGDVEICNPVNWNESVVLPCRTCQPAAYETERAMFIQKSGKVEQTIEMAMEKAETNILEFKQPEEPKLTIEEIATLEVEHNNLVRKFVSDEDTIRRLVIRYDEAAQCFRSPDFHAVTYSFSSVKRRIEDYKNRLEASGNSKD